jgi:hypothetical protein
MNERGQTSILEAGVILLLIVLALLIVVPTLTNAGRTAKDTGVVNLQLPKRKHIQYQEHATEKHGQDAVQAREGVQGCKPWNLRIKYCEATETHGASVHFWCETGEGLCPGTITTVGGNEKTSFLRPCGDWGCP